MVMSFSTKVIFIWLKSFGYLEIVMQIDGPVLDANTASLCFAASTGEKKMITGCGRLCPEFELLVRIWETDNSENLGVHRRPFPFF